jgi:hypothetical protein
MRLREVLDTLGDLNKKVKLLRSDININQHKIKLLLFKERIELKRLRNKRERKIIAMASILRKLRLKY